MTRIWKSGFNSNSRVGIADLIGAGTIEPGTTIYARRKAHNERTAVVLPDGRIDVDGMVFDTPSGAARHITGKSENGWWFFILSPTNRKSLSDLLQEYLDQSPDEVGDEVVDQALSDEDDEDDGDSEE